MSGASQAVSYSNFQWLEGSGGEVWRKEAGLRGKGGGLYPLFL